MAADEKKSSWMLIVGVIVLAVVVYAILVSVGVLEEPVWMYRMRHWTDEI
jgi:hypothetical protein